MNHIYRIIWSETLEAWVAVAENVKRKGKRSSKVVMSALVITAVQGFSTVNAGVSCTSVSGVSCQSSNSGFTQKININADQNGQTVGAIISGSNGSNGSNGALFVPPGSGGKGESINGVEYNIENIEFDPTTNILKVTYKASNSTAAYEATFTPINTSDDKSYIFDSSKTMGVSRQDGTYVNKVFTANSEEVRSESIVVNIVESNPDSSSTAITISSDKYGWTIQGDFSNDIDAGSGDSITVDVGDGISAPFTTIVNGNGKKITTNSSTTKTANSAAVYSISKGGDGGRGGSYYLGGNGKKGGKGGDASDAEIQVNDLTIDIRPSNRDGSIGVLALSQGGNGGKGGGSYTIAAGGGNGGGGGLGKNATAQVKNTTIIIHDNNSSGIAAISVAGDGGNGGNAGGIVSSGGKGNTAGQAGAVSVTTDNATRIEIVGHNSNGILAQSVAGAGGNGGSSIGLGALGGRGGMGGNANTATVNSSADIKMEGDNSYGITAQSIGGGGGNGGSVVAGVSLGATGAAGGDGDIVTVINRGFISIKGDSSYGILAQSIGGGGGNAGLTAGLAGIGGNGGSGGTAGNVDVVNTHQAKINTLGKNAHGIVAQSIGGGGGNGGLTAGVAAIGGDGGAGNDAGKVTVNNDANITTGTKNNKDESDNSAAILAQSIGGGGGNGSMAIGAGLGFSLAIGGNGAGGGKGGAVEVNVGKNAETELTTWGDNSSAIKAQSIGGGGGNGGATVSASIGSGLSASIALGGKGGNGAESSKVNVTTSSDTTISTYGDRSTGITAQSIGGAGGDGGMAIAANYTIGSAISVGLGGEGGEGAKAGEAVVENNATINTQGNDSTAILVQSIGGNGGTGGLSVAVGASVANAAFTLGGSGTSGGESQEAKIKNTANITTTGDGSSALVSQSIGGSGGNAGGAIAGSIGAGGLAVSLGANGGAGGHAGKSTIQSLGNIETKGHNSTAVVAQSIGGTGGNGGFSVAASASGIASASLALGGKGGGGGTADTVEVKLLAQESSNQVYKNYITTEGDSSSGILAQSIGGSGGNGGTAVSASVNGNVTGGGALSLAFGGTGGTGGKAGKVDLISDHYIQTKGQNSSAIIAQSIGGSGGNGGTSIAAAASGSTGPVSVSASIAIGGKAGSGAFANAVSVKNYGDLATVGDHSKGIIAQSIGGNGGAGGLAIGASITGGAQGAVSLSASVGGDGGDANVADTVTVENTGDITTLGDFSHGILAQSINGNGGTGGVSIGASIAGSGDKAAAATVTLGGNGGNVLTPETYKNNVNIINSNNTIRTFGDFSDGISAQAIGGNGGSGGLTIGLSASGSPNMAGSIAVGLGGNGGKGGIAGEIDIKNTNAAIYTKGTASHGINAQSIGGNGGNGGVSIAGSVAIAKETGAALSASVGGVGGEGNKASKVSVESKNDELIQDSVSLKEYFKDSTTTYISSIFTDQNSSNGINAQSIGGGGGNGGFAGSFSLSGTMGKALSAAVALGGKGGEGGSADKVTVTSLDNITTKGDDSNAILAQSIGGGGGNGGTSAAGSLSASLGADGAAYSVSVAIGGTGGKGNEAGEIDVTSSGDLVTLGDSSHAILAQSIGGGGGNGGMSISTSFTASRESSMQASASIGGTGGEGGSAKTVNVTRGKDGEIYTFGDYSTGITAQSIGGGGGNGGSAISISGSALDTTSVSLSLGGKGGSGNSAGIVNVENKSNIYTFGAQAQAIKAQSIGGGGGNGGSSISISATGFTKESATNIAAAVGGFGGDGNKSALVDVTNEASLLFTMGYGSQGILAQSIGGGGGNGGTSYSGTLNPGGFLNNETSATTLAASVGGFGGTGNTSGEVKIKSTGELIYTIGEFSSAIQAQSIGGGGGNGGNATTKALSFQCDDCDIADDNAKSDTNISLSVGGFGGNGHEGNKVSITNSTNLVTKGDGSNGIYAQSIGGGGGDGGNALVDAKAINLSEQNTGDHSLTLAVGGYKGTAAHANIVDITHSASIETAGINAKGILAQSIGGGGGNGGNAFGATVGVGGGALQQEIALGVKAVAKLFGEDDLDTTDITGSAGDAGDVTIKTTRSLLADTIHNIMTKGAHSDAIFAQSIGGGGGIGGSASGKLAIGGGAGAGGNAAKVDITNEINLFTSGLSSRGIVAQSIGGGGGAGGDVTGESTVGIGGSGSSAGNGGEVTVKNDAVISTQGYGSEGILAQSIGGGGGVGGSVTQATVAIGGGALENILNRVGVPVPTANGGSSGKVTVTNLEDATIQTLKDDSAAIVAQSISGGGGKGGSATGTLSLGGFGSDAGLSGQVEVNNDASLYTEGENSAGIIAQSIGGGGGIGGHASGTLGIGGFGSSGGKSGTVTVKNKGQISTIKVDSTAILAQSIAGGGGIGGGASGSVAIGGFGSDGANSDTVKVSNEGNLFTKGKNASAIVAQSVSGGGGKGGSSDGGVVTNKDNTTTIESAYVAIGGNGASAGNAGKVEVENTAKLIVTTEDQSKGIVAQSIAGGGGMGGEANGIDVSAIIEGTNHTVLATFDKGAAAVGLGNGAIYSVHNLSNTLASGLSNAADSVIGVLSIPLTQYFKNLAPSANGGSSDAVLIKNAKNSLINTTGNGSETLVAQSIAGGGGTTGSAKGLMVAGAYQGGAGNASTATASNKGILLTEGEHSAAIVAQSIAGGGGLTSGLDNVSSYAVLGGEGNSGSSASVYVNNENAVYTVGQLSSGVVAQSITGGGGVIGLSHNLQFGNSVTVGDAVGKAGDVESINTGYITTEGHGSVGIIAQSIGGGGGYAAGVDEDHVTLSTKSKGDAGDVVITHGPAPSTVNALSMQNNDDPDADDEQESVTSTPISPIQKVTTVYTEGDYAHGIIAQSIAGGGGFVNLIDEAGNITGFFAGTSGGEGKAGDVSISLDGRVITKGEGSIGVFAQSAGHENGTISIDIAKDSVIIGGTGNGAALALYDGDANTIVNRGYITGTGTIESHYVNDETRLEKVGFSDSYAIIGANSSNTITNDGGFITGSIYLPDGSSTLLNQNNGWVLTGGLMQFSNEFNSFAQSQLQNVLPQVGHVYNDANWSIGGVDEISSTSLIGDFSQLSSGVFYLDYDADRNSGSAGALGRMMTMSSTNSNIGTYDTMDVSGTANLDGTIAINVMNAGLVTPGDFNLNFINASDLNISSSLQLLFLPSAISRYTFQSNGFGGFSILSNYNYIQDGLTANGVRMGDVFNRIQTAQTTPAFEAIADVIYYSEDLETLQANYNALSGEGSAAIHQSAFTLANDSMNDISTQMDFWRSKSNLAKTNGSAALACSSEDASGSSRVNVQNCQESNKWRLWIAGNDGDQLLSGKAAKGIADVKGNSNRLIVALDYELDPNTLMGAAFIDGKARYEIKDRASSGMVDSTGITFFGIKDFDQYYVKALLGYDWLKATTTRDIYLKGNDQATPPVADIQNRVEADFDGQMLTTRVEAGYKYLVDGLNVTPFVGAQFAMTQYNRAKENETSGAGTDMGLKYETNRNYSAPLFVGVQFDKNYELDMGVLQPYARFSVNHDLSTDREVEAGFNSAPGYLFTINGGEPHKTSLDLNLGFKMNTKANVSLFGQYNGKFSSSSSKTDHLNFGIEYSW